MCLRLGHAVQIETSIDLYAAAREPLPLAPRQRRQRRCDFGGRLWHWLRGRGTRRSGRRGARLLVIRLEPLLAPQRLDRASDATPQRALLGGEPAACARRLV